MSSNIPNPLISQNIRRQVNVPTGGSASITVAIPGGANTFVAGYGYSYFTGLRTRLNVTGISYPWSTSQQGSIAQPVIFAEQLRALSGGNIVFEFENSSGSDQTVEILLILTTDRVIEPNIDNEGGAIITQVSTSAGGSQVAIYDSTLTSAAPVSSTFGLAVDPKPPASVLSGTTTTSSASAVALGSGALRRGVAVQADPTNADNVLVGNGTTQAWVLSPGEGISIECDNLGDVSIRRPGATNVTVNYLGS